MKRKAKVRRSRDVPPPATSEAAAARVIAPVASERISIESVDELKTGSIEAVTQAEAEKGLAGFTEPAGLDAARTR